ncbi:MAG: ornithine-acyl-ACP acyltransferase [Nevskia sp.]|nr:ornithine-acyl-ACP acyltransferase [Nevskia sp.]
MLTEYSNVPTARGASGLGQGAALAVSWAATEEDVRAALRLRFQVFAGEMGARLGPDALQSGLDRDRFDPYCDHLLVRAVGGPHDGMLLGTYRVLPPSGARLAGGFYSDREFDLGPLHALRPRALELGRSCVHPDWRSGGVILALWSALGQYMVRRRLDTMIGCASISLQDGAAHAAAIWHGLRQKYLADAAWQVRPRRPLALCGAPGSMAVAHARFAPATPPLIKGYLRCGARLLGPPSHDPAFNTADLPIMLRLDQLEPRYRKHFLGQH